MLLAAYTYLILFLFLNRNTFSFNEFLHMWHIDLVWDGRKYTEKARVRLSVLPLKGLETLEQIIYSVCQFFCLKIQTYICHIF